MLKVANIPHQYRWVDIFAARQDRPADFQQNARFHEVPLLLDDGKALVQSGAILLHLAQQTNAFGAESDERMMRCREWLMWEANKIGMCLPQLRSRHKFNDNSINDGAHEWLLARYEHDVNLLSEELSNGHPWIVPGNNPTIADFSLCGYLFLANEANVTVPQPVLNWLDRIRALPGWSDHHKMLSKDEAA